MADSESSLPTRRQGESADDYTARLKATPSSSGTSSGSGDSGGGGGSGGAASRSISTPTGNSRTIAGLMGMAIIFSVIGAEINPKAAVAGKAFSEPFLIIGGGTIAA